MRILGISAFYHDSSACLLDDGVIVACASEERFNRQKNSSAFPIQAINYCLQAHDVSIYDIDYVGFYEKPYLKFSRVILNYLQSYPFSLPHFLKTMPFWLQDRLILPIVLKRELSFEGKALFIKHHLSHAASAFLVSPFEKAAILTADGVGEIATMSYGVGEGNNITLMGEIRFPDSLGLLYTAVTTYLGFEALEGEGKVMGLAGYGKPAYIDKFNEMVSVKADGSFRINQGYFGFFNEGSRMYTNRFLKLFGRQREPGSKLEERHYDIAASLQQFTEDLLMRILENVHRVTGLNRLCLAGGLFLNCVANHKILEKTPFKELFIQPAAGDSGGSLGVAAYIYYSLLKNKREFVMTGADLGPSFSKERIKIALENNGIAYKELDDDALCKYVAVVLSQNKIVGWFQGRMEFGPRALGNRSILANPCDPGIKERLNAKVKHRESFRPYAPAVLEERAFEFFELRQLSPFMLLAARVRDDKKNVIPGVTHVDGTARIQTVGNEQDSRFRALIKAFEHITGVPMVLNTSFNLRGEPIVHTPEQAIEMFLKTQMDCLVMENCVLEK